MTVSVSPTTNLHAFNQLRIEWEREHGSIWCYMQPTPRPCFTPELLAEIKRVPQYLRQMGIDPAADAAEPGFLVCASRVPGIFNLGGDLELFRQLIGAADRAALEAYATACVEVSHQVSNGFGLPLTTIALIQGTALGGGMEGALSANLIVAERGVQMGLPEVLFNLFPGMGAYSFLSRRLGATETERMILSGKTWTSEELHEMGVIDILAERGHGEEAVRDYIRDRRKRSPNTLLALQKVRKVVNPVSYEELHQIAMIWVDSALRLTERDLRIMDRLVRSQNKATAATVMRRLG